MQMTQSPFGFGSGDDGSLDVTPAVDLLTVLFCTVLVLVPSATFFVADVKLPSLEKQHGMADVAEVETLTLTLMADDRLLLEQQPIDWVMLESELARKVATRRSTRILVSSDHGASIGAALRLGEMAQRLNVDLQFLATPSSQGDE